MVKMICTIALLIGVSADADDLKKDLKNTGKDIKKTAKDVGHRAKDAGREIGHGFKRAWHKAKGEKGN